jgi:purine-binding chemotaxis protein CheW
VAHALLGAASRIISTRTEKGEEMKFTVARLPGSSLPQKSDQRAGKYLSFKLEKEEFAIQVLRIREIMGIQEIMPVPQTPIYVRGVINLRGKVIPVIDLRLKFGMPHVEPTSRTSIIVTQVDCENGRMTMGTIVDGVTEVLTLQPGDIEDAPDSGEGARTPYLLGRVKIKGRVKTLLDINLLLTAQEIQDLEAVLQT